MDIDLWCMKDKKGRWLTLKQCENTKCELRETCSEYQLMTDAVVDTPEYYEIMHPADERGVKVDVKRGGGDD